MRMLIRNLLVDAAQATNIKVITRKNFIFTAAIKKLRDNLFERIYSVRKV